jgi:hypothetical protein
MCRVSIQMYCRALLVFLLLWQNPIRAIHALCTPLLFFDTYKSDMKGAAVNHFSSTSHESHYSNIASAYFGFRTGISIIGSDSFGDADGTYSFSSIHNSISNIEGQATLTVFTYLYVLEKILTLIGLNGKMIICITA